MEQQPYQLAANRINRIFVYPSITSFVGWATLSCPRGTSRRFKWCTREGIKAKKPAHPTIIALIALALSGTVNAGDATRHYHIPAQSLNNALMRFAAESNLELVFTADKVRGMTANRLDGTMTASQALTRLLQGSGMTYRFINAHSVTLEQQPSNFRETGNGEDKPQPQSNSNETGSDTTLPKVTVEADADDPYDDPTWQTDPYNTDYVLPKATAGTKTNTPVMETPLNVQVISKQVLKDQQVISLDKALRNVSGVTTTKTASGALVEKLFIRGFSTNTLFRNGFRMDDGDKNMGNGQQFANIESVEVLKGPAAILYGRVEPGGMVNVTTKQPLVTPYYSLNQQFGSYDLYRTSIDATGPLTKDDTLLYRMNASYQSNNSFRDLVSNEDVFLAPILKWNISPRTQATLEMEYQHENSNVDQQILPFDVANNKFIELPHNRNLLERNPLEAENIFVGFNWSHQFNDDWSIKHQVDYKSQDFRTGVAYFSAENLTALQDRFDRFADTRHNTLDTVATILDVTGHFKTWGLEHTLLFGGDYYRFDTYLDDSISDSFASGNFSSISISNPVHPSNPLAIDPSTRFKSNTSTDNYGLYLQDQIKLPYNVHVTGGLRYQYIHSTSESGLVSDGLTPGAAQTEDDVTPRVGILWQPQPWLSLYSNYAENFGPNSFNSFAFGGKLLPPTSAQQWEVGAKGEFFDGRLRATLAYYDLTKQNVASRDTDPAHFCNGGGAGSCAIAVGEIRSRGPELDIQGEILPGWNVIATYTNQDARVTKSNGDVAGAGIEVGNRPEFVPRNIGSVWTTYEVQQGDLKGFKIGGGVNMQDGVVNAANTIKSTGYALVGLMAGYGFEVGKTRITAQLNIDNLLDKTYFTNGTNYGSNTGHVNFSTPRTFIGSINIQY
ncbi:MAG: TonB-dependent receptor [Methyloglobulus sp.]|nr:TonB-dependent receptor [Methyloglobulus sp.]